MVPMSTCPSMACTARRSAPRSTKCVAKEWRSLCGEMCLRMPAARAWASMIFQKLCRVIRRPSRVKKTLSVVGMASSGKKCGRALSR